MSSDTRASCRHAVAFRVKLKHGEQQPIACTARNLSVEGMLLELGQVLLSIGDRVDLSISLKEGVFAVPAVVLHSNCDCTGVMFCRPQPALYSIITQPMGYAYTPINGRVALTQGVSEVGFPKSSG